jgi:hypothetical protein
LSFIGYGSCQNHGNFSLFPTYFQHSNEDMQILVSVGNALLSLWGLFRIPQYDAIIVGGGGGGCPLAQTLIEGGLRVLLVERGGEPAEETLTRKKATAALRSRCAEKILTEDGFVVAAGK